MIARLILGRLAQAVPVLLLVAALAFALGLVAGDPLTAALGTDASAAQRAAAATELGLDAPLPERYARFVLRVAQGDFGVSTRLARPVGALIAERLPATVELAGIAFIVSLVIGVAGGAYAAVRRDARSTRLLMFGSLLGVSLPTFLTGTLLILLFSATLRLLPSFGRGEVVALGPWTTGLLTGSGWAALVLPAATLAIFQSALLLRLVRASMIAAMESEFVRFARARGLSRGVVLHHALIHALVLVVSAASVQLGTLVAFSVVTETVFQWPGLGQLLVQSVAAADVPVIAAYLVMVAVLFVAINLVADLLCLAIDPRLRGVPRAGEKLRAAKQDGATLGIGELGT
jgi:peptide/nickel transport system permease protein